MAVCTYRRPRSLARALAALAAQEGVGAEWEVLVVDNEPPPGAEATVAAQASAFPVPVRLVRESVTGAAAARNCAIREASGDVLVFLDDDVVAEPGWLAALVAPIVEGGAEVTAGRVHLDPGVVRPRWFDEAGIGGYVTRLDLGERERELRDDEFVLTANAAFLTEVLRSTGGFDPALGPRPGNPIVNDDVQITRAVRAQGGRIHWVPGAIVVHELPPDRLRPSYLLRRAYAQGRSDWLLDRHELATRKLGGARVAMGWLGAELRRRGAEGPQRPEVAFHALCDIVRTAGALREAAVLATARP